MSKPSASVVLLCFTVIVGLLCGSVNAANCNTSVFEAPFTPRIVQNKEEADLKVVVPNITSLRQFVDCSDPANVSGFCIDVFENAFSILPKNLSKKSISYTCFNFPSEDSTSGPTYDDMIEAVSNGTYDAVVGDVTIGAQRLLKVDFTQKYMESGIVILTKVTRQEVSPWILFGSPFTVRMWFTVFGAFAFTGLVLWMVEHNIHPEFKQGPLARRIDKIFWLFVEMENNVGSSDTSNRGQISNSKKRKAPGIEWQYAINIGDRFIDWECKLCHAVKSGGAPRLREHFLGGPKKKSCTHPSAPIVARRIREEIQKKDSRKHGTPIVNASWQQELCGSKQQTPATSPTCTPNDGVQSESNLPSASSCKRNISMRQTSLQESLRQGRLDDAQLALAEAIYFSGSAMMMVDSEHWKRAWKKIGEFGPGFSPPRWMYSCDDAVEENFDVGRTLATTLELEDNLDIDLDELNLADERVSGERILEQDTDIEEEDTDLIS